MNDEDLKYDLVHEDTGVVFNTIILKDPKDIIVPAGLKLQKHLPPKLKETFVPEPINEISFIELLETAGGSTADQIVELYEDTSAQIKIFFLKLRSVNMFTPNDQFIISGLNAIDNAGYIPNGKDSIISNWPQLVTYDAV